MYRINNKDFLILNKYKSFLYELDDVLENVPRKDFYFKDKIREISYDVLGEILKCNNDRENVSTYAIGIKSGLATIDFMLDRLYDKQYISEKALYKIGVKLAEINKMTGRWIENGSKA